jgi:hypothetical protein
LHVRNPIETNPDNSKKKDIKNDELDMALYIERKPSIPKMFKTNINLKVMTNMDMLEKDLLRVKLRVKLHYVINMLI